MWVYSILMIANVGFLIMALFKWFHDIKVL